MKAYSLSHLADPTLLRELAAVLAQHRGTTATLLAYLAEVDERRLYLPAAHASMYSYCVDELHMSEETALRRIRVARAARQFPAVFAALAEGRLNLTAVLLLAPHLTPDDADELLGQATHKSKAEIELLLAERFPRPDVPTRVQAVDVPALELDPSTGSNVAECMGQVALEPVAPSTGPNTATSMGPLPIPTGSRAKLTPLSPGRFALQLTVSQHVHDQLRYANELLGHTVPSGDLATVIERALDELVERLERQKFAKAIRTRPRRGAAGSNNRYVPAGIRRTVWPRDGGQCTFVGEKGKRCEERSCLEYDHIEAVARGGQTTANGMRLRCRAHNQYAAECTFGAEFMRNKREQARCRAAEGKARTRAEARALAQEQARSRKEAPTRRRENEQPQIQAQDQSQPSAQPPAPAQSEAATDTSDDQDVRPWLRALGFNAVKARRGAELCAHIPDAPLQERLRVALKGLAPQCQRYLPNTASTPA